MNWGVEDFVAAQVILIGVGVGVLLILSRVQSKALRWLMMGGVILAALAVWAHLAVGVF